MEDNNDDDWGALADFDLTNDEEIKDIFGVGDMDDGTAQPSASIRTGFANAFFPENAPEACQNQPLAVGFYISTAPPGDLPDWFWASCPSAKRRAPVHLKSSLHITIQCAGGDQDQVSGDVERERKLMMMKKRERKKERIGKEEGKRDERGGDIYRERAT